MVRPLASNPATGKLSGEEGFEAILSHFFRTRTPVKQLDCGAHAIGRSGVSGHRLSIEGHSWARNKVLNVLPPVMNTATNRWMLRLSFYRRRL